MRKRTLNVVLIFGLKGQFHPVFVVPDLGVRPEQQFGVHPQGVIQVDDDRALDLVRVNGLEVVRIDGKALFQSEKFLLQDFGNAGQDVNVFYLNGGEPQAVVHEQFGPFGHFCHFQVGGVDRAAAEVLADLAFQEGVDNDLASQGAGDPVYGNVIVGRPDPARGENDVEPPVKVTDGFGNLLDLVGDHRDPLQRHPELAQFAG